MRLNIVLTLSSVLFKSYLRASRSGRVHSLYSNPRFILIIDLLALTIPLALLQYMLPLISSDLLLLLEPVVQQVLIGLPLMMTSIVILAGIMFELSVSGGLSSSETVNWLPISPREYVSASAASMTAMYSPFFAGSVGVTLPLALKFDLMRIWPVAVMLSAVALVTGAFFIEVLRAVVNRVSSTVYRRGGRFGIISRLVLLIILFVIIQMAFNPIILYSSLTVMVSSVEIVWFIPMVWTSVAVTKLINLETIPAAAFLTLSIIFTSLVFEVASNLRMKYWSPTPISITINASTIYTPQTTSLPELGFKPLEVALALKEFRALIRRKDMARFIAIPILLIVSYLLPTLYAPSDYSGRSPGFFLTVFIPFLVTLMFSMIGIGQEGEAVINLRMLPISAEELMKGKLLPVWIMSTAATILTITSFQIIAPMNISSFTATLVACVFVIVIESFIGFGIASRYPDYTVGSRSRYVTYTGFLIGFLAGGAAALALLIPTALYTISAEGLSPTPIISLPVTITLTVAVGSALSYLTYRYCKRGVEDLLTDRDS